MTGLFPPDAVIRRVDGEGVLLLGGGRALLMQIAHPSVAAGVAEHSGFEADPFGRLFRTLETTYAMVFGTVEEAHQAAGVINAVHDRVRGAGYDATDPDLLMWVHATLVDTALRVHARFLRPLSPADAERYYEESTLLAELLGVPRHRQPADLAEFRAYVRHMVATLEVTDDARKLARTVLHPRVPFVAEPVFEIARQLTVGLLPQPLREKFGFGWGAPRGAVLAAGAAAARQVLPRVPAMIRRAPTELFAAS